MVFECDNLSMQVGDQTIESLGVIVFYSEVALFAHLGR